MLAQAVQGNWLKQQGVGSCGFFPGSLATGGQLRGDVAIRFLGSREKFKNVGGVTPIGVNLLLQRNN